MKNKNIFVSTSNFTKKCNNNLNNILKNTANSYECLEIASGHMTDDTTIKLIDNNIKNGKKVLLHNYPFREKKNIMVNLCESDFNKRKYIINYIKEMILLSKRFNSNYFSIHGGFYPEKLKKIEQKKYKDIFNDTLFEIIKFAEVEEVYVGIENHVVEEKNKDLLYLYNKDEFNNLFNTIDSHYLKLHLDVGHLNVSSETYGFDKEDFIKEFSDKIMSVHLHDNNNYIDQHKNFNEDAYFLPYLKSIENLENIIIETWNQSNESIDEMIRKVQNVI